MRKDLRTDGYAGIRDYAAVGDGRTVALIAADGSVDWWCAPRFDSASVFAGILDASNGGRFALAPATPYEVQRRYLPETNVLETTFTTADGVVRVTDALNLETGATLPWRELARRVEGVSGSVPMQWHVQPRFGYGQRPTTLQRWDDAAVAVSDDDAMAIFAWDAGEPVISSGAVHGRFTTDAGTRSLLALAAVHAGPRVYLRRREVEQRLDSTASTWTQWAQGIRHDGPWRDAVVRSALALQLLMVSASGAIVAAPTTSLPEHVGGSRNYDYRYMWVRDSSFALDAFLRIGLRAHAHASLTWLLHATAHTSPRLQPIYGIEGEPRVPDGTLPLHGYRGSDPVRVGNSSASQIQLGNYGDLLETTWLYVRDGHRLDPETGARMADIADLVCDIWHNDDGGIWELSSKQRPYTISKMACWAALDRTCKLVDAHQLPDRHTGRWRTEAAAIRAYIENNCWSQRKHSYTFHGGADLLDVGARSGGVGTREVSEAEETELVCSTVDALRARFDVPLSVDTWRANVAAAAFCAGAVVGNDMSGFRDPDYLPAAAAAGAAVVATHMRLPPQVPDPAPAYDDVVCEVRDELEQLAGRARAHGIPGEQIMVDPGLDLGKTWRQSVELLAATSAFAELGFPLLVAPSNKIFLGRLLGLERHERSDATVAASAVAALRGARVLRVHEASGARHAADLVAALLKTRRSCP